MRDPSSAPRRSRALSSASRRRRPTSLLAAAALIAGLLAPAQTLADEWRPAAIAVDLLVFRTLGFVATAGGFALFLPAAVASLPGGRDSTEEAWERFVRPTGREVFGRPLGEF